MGPYAPSSWPFENCNSCEKFEKPVCASQKLQYVYITNINWLILLREISAVYVRVIWNTCSTHGEERKCI
jgi:hypothetical protein